MLGSLTLANRREQKDLEMQKFDASEVKGIRKALGFTQQQFGEAIGVSRPTVSLMESGTIAVSRETSLLIERLADRNLPSEISVSTFGNKFVVVATKRNGNRNIHEVLRPAYKSRDLALAAARVIAHENLATLRS